MHRTGRRMRTARFTPLRRHRMRNTGGLPFPVDGKSQRRRRNRLRRLRISRLRPCRDDMPWHPRIPTRTLLLPMQRAAVPVAWMQRSSSGNPPRPPPSSIFSKRARIQREKHLMVVAMRILRRPIFSAPPAIVRQRQRIPPPPPLRQPPPLRTTTCMPWRSCTTVCRMPLMRWVAPRHSDPSHPRVVRISLICGSLAMLTTPVNTALDSFSTTEGELKI